MLLFIIGFICGVAGYLAFSMFVLKKYYKEERELFIETLDANYLKEDMETPEQTEVQKRFNETYKN